MTELASLSLRRANLSPAKRALLDQWTRGQGAPSGIPRRTERGPVPLSFAQQRLWFLDQLAPGTAAYNMAGALHLAGRLDVDALERVIGHIVQRHEALRTTFAVVDGHPAQVTAPAGAVTLPKV